MPWHAGFGIKVFGLRGEVVNLLYHLMVDKSAELLARLAPPRCLLCGGRTATQLLCDGCKQDLPWNDSACPGCAIPHPQNALCPVCARKPRAFDSAWAAFRMEGPIKPAIHGLKYHARFEQARCLGQLMSERLRQRSAPLPELILPVPLHWRRLMGRGYNQALELGRSVSQDCGIPLDATLLRQTRATPDQIGRRAAERRRNVRGAFECRADLSGRHVALLDDVMTTGATLDELARCLRAAGACRIEAWAVARA